MSAKNKFKHILYELREHMPFTLGGAVVGLIFMLLFRASGQGTVKGMFMVTHLGHVVLSAMVTAAIFKLHLKKKNFLIIMLVGWLGAIGIATLSDILIPHMGAEVFGLKAAPHSAIYHPDEHVGAEPDEHSSVRFEFIEHWYIVNPAAILGVLLAYFWPRTKFPHAAHVLISTWASSSYLLMAAAGPVGLLLALAMLAVLFVSVWLPCCISDIIFPLLFVQPELQHSDLGRKGGGSDEN